MIENFSQSSDATAKDPISPHYLFCMTFEIISIRNKFMDIGNQKIIKYLNCFTGKILEK